ncbi:MAG: MBL fold metallo-hydrolase, partial [Deltaproteobacteria bacterium]|nr:MBL fold metallo-hydrolase [Deltaproteobacteria bacterium]
APSAQRAALTACLALGLRVLMRRASPVAISALAILLLTLRCPEDALSPALLLSVLATSALLGGGGEGDALRRLARSAGRALLITTPFTAYVFAQAPLLGWLANVLLLPLFALVLVPLTWLHAAVALALPELAPLTGEPLSLLVRALLSACAAAAALAPSTAIAPLSVAQGLALACGCGLALFTRRRRHGLLLLCALALILGGLEWRLRVHEQPHDRLRVTYLDIGQGDAALVDLPDGRLMMIDAGPRDGLAPERVILPLLAARRRDHLDVFVLTHGHPDHYGGLEALLDAGLSCG